MSSRDLQETMVNMEKLLIHHGFFVRFLKDDQMVISSNQLGMG